MSSFLFYHALFLNPPQIKLSAIFTMFTKHIGLHYFLTLIFKFGPDFSLSIFMFIMIFSKPYLYSASKVVLPAYLNVDLCF